ncbi:MAG: hypothetical protein MZW92_41505 [Comamonadaceae bacterium]|nr:hypothetical protein [Comamonadaceae bacterium]
MQRLTQLDFLRGFIRWQPFRRNSQFQHGGHQLPIAGLQAGVTVQSDQGSLLILSPPGRIGINLVVSGGQGDQPEIEIAVQFPPRQQGQFRGQLQGFRVPAGQRDLLAQSGDARQPMPPRAVSGGRDRRDPQAGIAAEGAEQQSSGFLDLGQGDRRVRVVAVTLRRAGDEAMPERADVFFHVNANPARLATMNSLDYSSAVSRGIETSPAT